MCMCSARKSCALGFVRHSESQHRQQQPAASSQESASHRSTRLSIHTIASSRHERSSPSPRGLPPPLLHLHRSTHPSLHGVRRHTRNHPRRTTRELLCHPERPLRQLPPSHAPWTLPYDLRNARTQGRGLGRHGCGNRIQYGVFRLKSKPLEQSGNI